MASSRCLVLFSKPAIPGHVKTRLIGELTAQEAAELHAAFLEDLLGRLRRGAFDLRIAWAVEPPAPLPAAPVAAFRQRGADLGERLFRGLSAVAGEYAAVAAIGSDHPDLPLERVEEAFERLEGGAPLVIGPADDGGYWLIGGSAATLRRELFEDIPWSGPGVLARTIERCRELAMTPSLLPAWSDVDGPADLERLAVALGAEQAACPRTRALLAAWGRL